MVDAVAGLGTGAGFGGSFLHWTPMFCFLIDYAWFCKAGDKEKTSSTHLDLLFLLIFLGETGTNIFHVSFTLKQTLTC